MGAAFVPHGGTIGVLLYRQLLAPLTSNRAFLGVKVCSRVSDGTSKRVELDGWVEKPKALSISLIATNPASCAHLLLIHSSDLPAMLNLVFILDITGSMGSEVEGVKQTVSKLVESVFNENYAVMVTIITYTENAIGCYVTNDSFTEGDEAMRFVSSIQLCKPPGSTGIEANGGDGDENAKAALAELLRLDNTMPTIAFLITDAGPHLVADRTSSEAQHEMDYLKREHNVVNTDLFHVLELVHAQFGDKLILNVIKFIKNSDHCLYGAVAKKFGGVLITPQDRSPSRLAAGMFSILTQMFDRILGQASGDSDSVSAAALTAFNFFDLQYFVVPTSEPDVTHNGQPSVGSTKDVLFQFLERATVVVGDKFGKRAVDATALQEQVELLLVIAKCLLKLMPYNTALDRANTLIVKIQTELPPENKGHFKIQVEDLPSLLSKDLVSSSELTAAVSAITLMSTEETAKDSLEEDAAFDPRTTIQTVAGLFLCHLAVLQLPEKNGKLDFMDSWSAVISKISNDIMTTADFLHMIGYETTTGGLSDRKQEYNYAQLFADPNDAVGSELLHIASGTQILDIITALAAGAPAGQFCPFMFRGTLAGSLLGLLSQYDPSLSSYQWDIVRKLVYTIRLVMGPMPSTMPADPELHVGKMLFRLLRMIPAADLSTEARTQATQIVLEELLATRIQKFAKYNQSAYLKLIQQMVGYEHQSEVLDVFEPHVLDADTWRFETARAVQVASESSVALTFTSCAENLIQAVYELLKNEDDVESKASALPSIADIWPSFTQDLPKYLLLQLRKNRFVIDAPSTDAAKSKTLNWRRLDLIQEDLKSETYAAQAMQQLQKQYDTFLRSLRLRRANEKDEQRWHNAIRTMKAPFEEFVDTLKVIGDTASRDHKLLLRAFKSFGTTQLSVADYEAKLQVLITGRVVQKGLGDEIVFNRGNLHPHPDRFVPMSETFQTRLRKMQQRKKWPLSHIYRPSGVPNHSGHSNSNPSAWAAKRSLADKTFWEV